MRAVTFNGYGVGSRDVTVIAEEVEAWSRIDYNGMVGTQLEMKSGRSIHVGEYPSDVERKLIPEPDRSTR